MQFLNIKDPETDLFGTRQKGIKYYVPINVLDTALLI